MPKDKYWGKHAEGADVPKRQVLESKQAEGMKTDGVGVQKMQVMRS